jgi:hypothetical protein
VAGLKPEIEKASSIQPPAMIYARPGKTRRSWCSSGFVDPFTARMLSARDEQQRF